jgi:hypothetical protein
MNRKALLVFGLGLAAAAAAVVVTFDVLELFEPIFYYDWKQQRMVRRVMAANPEQVSNAARELLSSRRGFTGHINPSALDLPTAIRAIAFP